MDPALATAGRAADGLINADPVLGSVCVLLAIALAGLLIWHFIYTGRLHKEKSELEKSSKEELVEQERGFRKEALALTAEVTKGLETMRQTVALLSARGP